MQHLHQIKICIKRSDRENVPVVGAFVSSLGVDKDSTALLAGSEVTVEDTGGEVVELATSGELAAASSLASCP